MKKNTMAFSSLMLVVVMLVTASVSQAQVKIGTNPGVVNGNSVLELESTSKGVLLPRSTSGQIATMTSAPKGMIVFNTTDSVLYLRRDTGWVALTVTRLGVNPTYNPQPINTNADIYALMPADNPAPIAVNAAIAFPQTGVLSGGISRASASSVALLGPASYHISFVVSVNEPAQLGLFFNGALLPNTVVGRASGSSQIASTCIITIATGGSLELRNISATPITLTPNAGGANPVSAHLSIIKVL